MKRRDFLLLRPERRGRVVDIRCGRLYMRYLDAVSAAARAELQTSAGAADDPRGGESPPALETPSVAELLAALDDALRSSDVARLVDPAWLDAPAFKQEVDRVLATFRARGGTVEIERGGGR
jgi:hypothetical protein